MNEREYVISKVSRDLMRYEEPPLEGILHFPKGKRRLPRGKLLIAGAAGAGAAGAGGAVLHHRRDKD